MLVEKIQGCGRSRETRGLWGRCNNESRMATSQPALRPPALSLPAALALYFIPQTHSTFLPQVLATCCCLFSLALCLAKSLSWGDSLKALYRDLPGTPPLTPIDYLLCYSFSYRSILSLSSAYCNKVLSLVFIG